MMVLPVTTASLVTMNQMEHACLALQEPFLGLRKLNADNVHLDIFPVLKALTAVIALQDTMKWVTLSALHVQQKQLLQMQQLNALPFLTILSLIK